MNCVNCFHNLMGILYGMRTYRLVSAVEFMFALAFTVIGVAALAIWPTGVSALVAHLLSLTVTLALLAAAIRSPRLPSGAEPRAWSAWA